MLTVAREGSVIRVEATRYTASIHTEGYVSGVAGGTFVDKQTGAHDHSFGLDIADFLLEPVPDDGTQGEEDTYVLDPLMHGQIAKRYVELPQICTQARRLQAEVLQGDGWVAVRQGFRWTRATRGRTRGSSWEQVMVFPEDTRHFYAMDRVTSVNAADKLIMRIDLPAHLKHDRGDVFEQVYLSYHGYIPAQAFLQDFPPDAAYLYQRGVQPTPRRMIRARQHRVEGRPGPWLGGLTLDPSVVHEAWCHQRGYICFIQEIGGVKVQPGDSFSAAYAIGWFDSVAQMEALCDRHAGMRAIELDVGGWRLV